MNGCSTRPGAPLGQNAKLTPHPLPKPLDTRSYHAGRLVPPAAAKPGQGWTLAGKWRPAGKADRAGTRPGFVNVPMLTAEKPGAELTFAFRGRAVGIWIIAGPDVGVVEYKIDGGTWQKRDQFTRWSHGLHLPWVLVLADELTDGDHTLALRTTNEKNPRSRGHACRIVHFCVNGG